MYFFHDGFFHDLGCKLERVIGLQKRNWMQVSVLRVLHLLFGQRVCSLSVSRWCFTRIARSKLARVGIRNSSSGNSVMDMSSTN